ncbi:MAG: ribonuclease Z [Candidatus Omnitrophica bacterium]|nr:ribonuclease Z [Candidatus Omnitrophota bacterium]MBU4148723.1 ribonuclease Z [Candidatus Omnitrophota bacterium]
MRQDSLMEITLVGTGTGTPSIRRNPACILFKLGNKNAVFDSGPGTIRSLLAAGVDYTNIDLVFYTHLHLDHVSDFSAILFAAKIPPETRKRPLRVYGPSGLKAYYKHITELYGDTVCPDSYKLLLEEIANKDIDIDGFIVSTKTLEHHDGGMGYRVTEPGGKVAVYTGDTDYCEAAVGLSRNADILIAECSFPDEIKMKGHLTPSSAARLASEADVKKLVLVHMYPVCDSYDLISCCKKTFAGEVIVGEDMMKFELKQEVLL